MGSQVEITPSRGSYWSWSAGELAWLIECRTKEGKRWGTSWEKGSEVTIDGGAQRGTTTQPAASRGP